MRDGEVIGGYRIESRLGDGGMGEVFLAQHELLGRQAAVKVLLPQYSHNEEMVERFFREAKASSSILHPGIVQIFDFGYHSDGSAYIVMEFLPGESLDDRLKRLGRLSPGDVLRIGKQIAGALAAAHERGIVHRDLKPENVFLVPDPDVPGGERAKVLDFGIAKLADAGDSRKTKTGMVMGTPVYMSPEQSQDVSSIDARSDIYSLGCVLFHLLCGRPPFQYAGLGQLFAAHLAEPPPRASSCGAPPELDDLLERTLAKSPDARPQSMANLSEALEQLEDGGMSASAASAPTVAAPSKPSDTTLRHASGVAHPEAPSRSSRPWGLAALLLTLFALGGGAVALFLGGGGRDSEASAVDGELDAMSPEAAAPSAAETAPPADASSPPPDASPAMVTVQIESKPTGAEVRRARQGEAIGVTPFDETREAADDDLTYWIVKRGYRAAKVQLDGARGGAETAHLERRRRPARRPAPKPERKPNSEQDAKQDDGYDPGDHR